jgi:hypothetical protein
MMLIHSCKLESYTRNLVVHTVVQTVTRAEEEARQQKPSSLPSHQQLLRYAYHMYA